MPQEPISPDMREALGSLPREEERRLTETWRDLERARPAGLPAGAPSTEEAWGQLQSRLDRTGRTRPDRPPVPRGRRLRLPVVALGMMLLAAVVAVWWIDQPVTITTHPGETLQLRLGDGTRVALAPASALITRSGLWDRVFRSNDSRAVALRGEAFFEVEASPRPFVVRTSNAVVEVIGTSFNVRSRTDETARRTIVEVLSGRVRLRSSDHAVDAVLLGAAERSSVGPEGIDEPVKMHGDQIAVWRDGGFAIHHLPLGDVLREIERRYDVTIRSGRDIPHDVPITLFYRRAADAETIIHDIALATDLHYRVLRGGFELVQPASR